MDPPDEVMEKVYLNNWEPAPVVATLPVSSFNPCFQSSLRARSTLDFSSVGTQDIVTLAALSLFFLFFGLRVLIIKAVTFQVLGSVVGEVEDLEVWSRIEVSTQMEIKEISLDWHSPGS